MPTGGICGRYRITIRYLPWYPPSAAAILFVFCFRRCLRSIELTHTQNSDHASTPEFSSLVGGTIDVAKAATGTAVHVAGTVLDASICVALLPVTIPVAVASIAVSTVVSVACVATGGVLKRFCRGAAEDPKDN